MSWCTMQPAAYGGSVRPDNHPLMLYSQVGYGSWPLVKNDT